MTVHGLTFAVTFKIIFVQSNMVLAKDLSIQPILDDPEIVTSTWEDDSTEKVLSLKEGTENEQETDFFEISQNPVEGVTDKPCSVVVLSDIKHNNMQSLLRKYRYNAKGVLIPGSVRYFIKYPQGMESEPILVPLNNKAFSPLGGFVRYYKEVPPIPQSW